MGFWGLRLASKLPADNLLAFFLFVGHFADFACLLHTCNSILARPATRLTFSFDREGLFFSSQYVTNMIFVHTPSKQSNHKKKTPKRP